MDLSPVKFARMMRGNLTNKAISDDQGPADLFLEQVPSDAVDFCSVCTDHPALFKLVVSYVADAGAEAVDLGVEPFPKRS